MAEKIAVLNLGSQNIALGLFEVDESSVQLITYVVDGILADPSNEAIRNSQIQHLLGKLVDGQDIKSLKVYYSVPGQSVFTRFVKLPALGDGDIDQLVAFEAEQHIPYPIGEVVWDWEMIDESGAEKEVAVVAIKKTIINQIDEMVSSAGLISKSVESSQFSLANSYYHSYGMTPEPVLIIDLGAKSSNLIFIQGTKIFIRSVGVSGVAVTSAVAKEYKVEFAKAEEFKIGSGRIAINSAYLQEWDEQTGALAQSVTNAMSRLPSEVTRTINYWRSQEGGSPPTKILLAGGGSNMPYFKEYVEERLSIPTEYFNPLQNVFLSSEIDQEKIVFEAHTLGELVGLAAKAAKNSELSIDLVPDSISERRAEDRKKPFFVSASLIACAGALIWAGTQFLGNVRADAALTEIKKEVASYSDIDKGISKVTKETKTLESENKHLSELVEERYRAVEQLDELKSYLSSEVVWLKSVEEVVNYKFDDPEGVEDQALVKDSSVNYGTSALSSKHKGTKSTKRKKSTKGDDEKAINALLIKGYWRANPQNQQVVFEMLEKIKSAENSRFTLTYKNNELDDSEVLFIDTVIPDGKIKAEFKLILPLKNPIEIVTK